MEIETKPACEIKAPDSGRVSARQPAKGSQAPNRCHPCGQDERHSDDPA